MRYLQLLIGLFALAGSLQSQIYIKPRLLGPPTYGCANAAVAEARNMPPGAAITTTYGTPGILNGDSVNLCYYGSPYYSEGFDMRIEFFPGYEIPLATSTPIPPKYNYEISGYVAPVPESINNASCIIEFDSILDPSIVQVWSMTGAIGTMTWLDDHRVLIEGLNNGANYLSLGDYWDYWANFYRSTFYLGDPIAREKPHLQAYAYATPAGSCLGTVDISTNYSEGPLTFDWDIPGAGNTNYLDSLCPGTYAVTVSDSSLDTVRLTFTIEDLPLYGYAIVNNATFGCNASVQIYAVNTNGEVHYTWNTDAAGDVSFADSLCPGNYWVLLEDGTDSYYVGFDIYDYTPPLDGYLSYTTGALGCTGTAAVNLYNAIGPVSYTWYLPDSVIVSDGAYQDSLCPGYYFVQATDSMGRTYQSGFQIYTLGITGEVVTTDSPYGCTGTANVFSYNAAGPVSYEWSVPGAPDEATIDSLCPGDYWVKISDSLSDYQIYFTVTNNFPPLYISVENTYETRHCDGFASLTVTNAVGPVTYHWNIPNSPDTSYVDGLCPGNYYVTVTDSLMRSTYAYFYIYGQILVAHPNINHATWGCTGTAEFYVYGNIGTLSYEWSVPGNTNQTFVDSLCPGDYWVRIVDDYDADTLYKYFTIENATPPLIVYVSGYGTADCMGSADAFVYNSMGDVYYEWSIPGAGNGYRVDSLCPGDYWIKAIDNWHTDTAYYAFRISDPGLHLEAQISVTDANNGCNGSVTYTYTGNDGPVGAIWKKDPHFPYESVASPDSLCPGFYLVVIGDESYDSVYFYFTINDMTPPPFEASVITTGAFGGCNGTASVFTANEAGPVTYSWDIPGSTNEALQDSLCEGVYTVLITDGVDTVVRTVYIEEQHLAGALQMAQQATFGCNGSATIEAFFAEGPVTFTWDIPGIGNSPEADSLCAGLYTVMLTDSSGDTAYVYLYIYDDPLYGYALPQAVTNGACNGSVQLVLYNDYQPSFTWSVPGATNEASLDSLCPGTYWVKVSDMSGDSLFIEFEIEDQTPAILPADTLFFPGDSVNFADCFMDPALPYDSSGRYIYAVDKQFIDGISYRTYEMNQDFFQNHHYLRITDTLYYINDSCILVSRYTSCTDMTPWEMAQSTAGETGNAVSQEAEAFREPADGLKISLYPNPSNELLNVTIETAGETTVHTVEFFDAYGKLVKTANTARTRITDLATGVYMLRINGKSELHRFVKID